MMKCSKNEELQEDYQESLAGGQGRQDGRRRRNVSP
jgi:hypothetical protein